MIDKSLIFENIQKNRYDLVTSQGAEALYAVLRDFSDQPASIEQMITDYIMKYKNMFRTDRNSYNYDTFLTSFTSTIELSIQASDSGTSIRTIDLCEYYPKRYNYITSLECSDFHRMLAMMTENSTGIISSNRLYSVIMRQGAFLEAPERRVIEGFLQIYDAMLFTVIKKQHDNPGDSKYSYNVYKDILGLYHRMEEVYGSENSLVKYVGYSLETFRRSLPGID